MRIEYDARRRLHGRGDPDEERLMNDDLLTYPEAARLAGVSLVTIKRAVRDGRLPVVRTSVPRRAYIPRKALEAALRARPQ